MAEGARTEAQKAADDKLTEAINEALVAYGMDDPNQITLNYIVLVEHRVFDDDGDQSTALSRIYKDNECPWMNILGMLRAATLRVESEWVREL